MTAPLVFDRRFDPRYGEAVQVAPGIRRITARNPGPFTLLGTNTYLIGKAEMAVLDPGPEDDEHLDAVLRAVGTGIVTHILVSHAHRDHAAGAAALKARTGAPILAAAMPGGSEARQFAGGADAARAVQFQPDLTIGDGDAVHVEGRVLHAVATPGHAPDHIAFALPEFGILFCGDHVMGWSTTVVAPPDGSMRDYMGSLEKLLARGETLYLPAHGGIIADGPAMVRSLRAHRLTRESAILRELGAGHGTIGEIVPRIYGGLDPALVTAASLSTLAHLEELVERGEVRADATPSLAARYSLAGSSSSGGTGEDASAPSAGLTASESDAGSAGPDGTACGSA